MAAPIPLLAPVTTAVRWAWGRFCPGGCSRPPDGHCATGLTAVTAADPAHERDACGVRRAAASAAGLVVARSWTGASGWTAVVRRRPAVRSRSPVGRREPRAGARPALRVVAGVCFLGWRVRARDAPRRRGPVGMVFGARGARSPRRRRAGDGGRPASAVRGSHAATGSGITAVRAVHPSRTSRDRRPSREVPGRRAACGDDQRAHVPARPARHRRRRRHERLRHRARPPARPARHRGRHLHPRHQLARSTRSSRRSAGVDACTTSTPARSRG